MRLWGGRRTAIWGGVALLAVWATWHYRAQASRSALRFETVKADRGKIVAKVTATGTLSALVTVQVGSQVSGTIQQLFVDFNSPVKRGQVVAKIDPRLFEAALEQAKANELAAKGNLRKAEAQSADAERQAVRFTQLFKDALVAQADLETAKANADAAAAAVEAAKGSLAQAEASLHQAAINLDYTTIVSPTDGVVISRNVDVGQTVAASLQAPVLFQIAQDLRKMQVDTSVAEADIGKLEVGRSATFTVDAYAAENFQGTIRQIRYAPQTLQNVVTYDAVIDVDNHDVRLKPGMTANVTFVYAQRDDVLRVPNAALRFRPAPELLSQLLGTPSARRGGRPAVNPPEKASEGADRKVVWVLKDKVTKRVPIRAGVTDGTVTEVVEGEIQDGDILVTDASGTPTASAGTSGFRRLF